MWISEFYFYFVGNELLYAQLYVCNQQILKDFKVQFYVQHTRRPTITADSRSADMRCVLVCGSLEETSTDQQLSEINNSPNEVFEVKQTDWGCPQ